MKRWNKSGQFYLLAAILIIAVIIGFVAVNNYSKNKSPIKIYDVGKELDVEGAKVVDWGTVQQQDLSAVISNFYGNFSLYAGEGNRQITFILGNETEICVYASQVVSTGDINIGGSGIPTNENRINKTCGQNVCERTPLDGGREKITCTLNSVPYVFELTPGENFYFIISQEISGEQHVITG
ncbi:Uncharacterised protein [uncultured archaeon]|nr:Uncharacterised protein [uncultured archaeon]